MMEINLLNRTGIHTKNNHDFNDIDKSFLSRKDEVLGKDFERDHKVDSTISIKKNDRSPFAALHQKTESDLSSLSSFW